MRLLACALVGLAVVALPPAPVRATSTTTAIGDVRLRDLEGRGFRLGELTGQVVVVDAWATWCAPCLAELPKLRRLHTSHRENIVVVGINLDTMSRRDLRAWLGRHDVHWRQHFDGRGYASPVAVALAIDKLPATFLVDRAGRVAARDLRGDRLVSAALALAAAGSGR